MGQNTDPVRALDYTPGRLDETAPERIWLQIDTAGNNADRDLPFPDADGVTWEQDSVGGLEIQYVRADLASAPPSAPEPEVHSYDPTERRETVTIRWPDGKYLGYVLDRTRYTDNLPPSAPVGVEGEGAALSAEDLATWLGRKYARHGEDEDRQAAAMLRALAQQPAAPSAPVGVARDAAEYLRDLLRFVKLEADKCDTANDRHFFDSQAKDIERVIAALAQQPAAPLGTTDSSTYSDIETALDRIDAPARAEGGRWLTLPERIAAIKPAAPSGEGGRVSVRESALRYCVRELNGARRGDNAQGRAELVHRVLVAWLEAAPQQPAGVDEDDDAEPVERCESGLPDCGPAVAWDCEGVGACERCAKELGWIAAQQQGGADHA